MGLIKCGNVVIPFDNQISKDTDLYKLYNTNIHEKIAEQKKAGKIADDAESEDKAVEPSGVCASEPEGVIPVKLVSARDMVEEHPDRTVRKQRDGNIPRVMLTRKMFVK